MILADSKKEKVYLQVLRIAWIQKSKERQNEEVNRSNISRNNITTKMKTTIKNLENKKWKEKHLHIYFKKQSKEITHKITRTWLKNEAWRGKLNIFELLDK